MLIKAPYSSASTLLRRSNKSGNFVMEEHAGAVLSALRAGQILLERSDFQIRFACLEALDEGSALIDRLYSRRGYKSRMSLDPGPADRITLQACSANLVFATVTLSFDGCDGLAADALYRSEIDAYRIAGARVCEVTRLAIEPAWGSKEVLGALFHVAYVVSRVLRGTSDAFIEVNPRHASFYERMLHFRRAGECRMCERVDAPAVLLHLTVAHMREQIALYGSRREEARGSLYRYFLSVTEERSLGRRILSPQTSSWRLQVPTAEPVLLRLVRKAEHSEART
jgi:hypothetical protein